LFAVEVTKTVSSSTIDALYKILSAKISPPF